MATPIKRWPTEAEWARCDCIAIARRERRSLDEALDQINDIAILRRVTRTIEALWEIETKLTSVGPKEKL
jgi:hypothetical protein